MERRYVRQYQNYDTIIPDINDFQILNGESNELKEKDNNKSIQSVDNSSFKADDLILLGLLAIFLMEENKNWSMILILGLIFISDYIN